MGNIPGMPEIPTPEIKEIAEQTMKTFTPIYVKSYGIGLINKLKRQADEKAGTTSGPEWQLLTPPIPSEPLHEGWMTKLGAVKKNWKKRYFVAKNQADNFVVQYFEKEDQKTDEKKKKGAIQTCGYRVKHMDKEEEKKEFGDFAITLKPWGRRRQWYLKCEDAESLKTWEGVLKYAARGARPPLNEDEVMRFAFQRAYPITRWRLGVWGWYYVDKTEDEMLGQLVVDKCNEGCMGPVYDKIPGGRLERKIRQQVEKVLDQTVGAVVGAGWKAVVSTIDGSKGKLEEAAKGALGQIFDKEAELKVTVKDKILSIISPPLEKLSKPVLTPICNCLMAPLVAAYKELAIAYWGRMNKILTEVDAAGDADAKVKALNDGLARFTRDIRYWWGVMRPALRQIYKAFRDGWSDDEPETGAVTFSVTVNLGDIIDMLDSVSPWQIEDQFETSLRRMMGRAIYTFAKTVEDDKDAVHKDVVKAVMGKLVHDSKAQVRLDIQEIFLLVLGPPFRKTVNPLIKDVLEPVASLIPDALKSFLDIEKMAQDIMDNVLTETIANCINPASEPVLKMLDSLPTDLGYA
mmetsp:Transcript_70890/g.125252  ORF Transcript_70890/g.125252 Transcript_70890/m.125252 type:complete len:574 (-) Transcript_70890:334-2055(-)|eukprot:CAMPEP_0197665424 /NCGR_PEP_ID=MMETSP1338-20131121/59218_1 /TAXON_ID=43686 ORGANISM="Pelagodinium beii, Strain RCC1491" /NCGR_SAMPLE_ID=MMETSP1338 /ASSEMBLY_ACC=CAM_ASM_000754 /LENGTH=573 /DNA_ID=CAMNT_0043244227 /DNA_START=186 /DNA_END=1907 /DNA_ORIENTATION=-